MAAQTDPPERPGIRAADDTLTAAVNKMTAAIRELTAASKAERRSNDRAIQWLSIGFGALGALATAFAVITTLLGN